MFRDYEKKYCINSLKEGNSLLILGIRRTGKSSLLKEVGRLMRDERYLIIEVDCQGCNKPSELFIEILKELPKDLFEKLTKHLNALKGIPSRIIDALNIDSIKGFGVDIKFDKEVRDYWGPISESIERILLNNEQNIILFLDELPYFFENLLDNNTNCSELEVQQILATLRSWRNEEIQMALCGSLNINNFLDSKSISQKLLSGLIPVHIELFTSDEAKQLLFALAKSRNIDWIKDETAEKVIELVQDNVPFFIQTFFSHMVLESDCSIQKLEEIYGLKVYPQITKTFLYQFDERLAKYSRDEYKHAEIILDYIAKNSTASFEDIRKDNKFIEFKTFLKLISDEFLKPEKNNNYSFVLNIVKNWWKVKRGL